jgi:hypothetical protein
LSQQGGPRVPGLDDSAFSDEFCRFLQASVPSVEAAELLLALAGEPLQAAMKPGDTERYLELFRVAGLLQNGHDGAPRCAPADAALAAHVEMLRLAYKQRPVTLFRIIYALRDPKIRRARDAFRLRTKQ